MIKTSSADKKRSSIAEDSGQSKNMPIAKKRFSPATEANQSEMASTDLKRSSYAVEADKADTSLLDKKRSSLPVDTRHAENKPDSVAMETVQSEPSCIDRRRSPTFETVPYEVQISDTLTSIGARFDMAPSELKQLNKLMSNHIYPKQKLLIYRKNFLQAEEREKFRLMEDEEKKKAEYLEAPRSRHSSAAASDLLRLRNPSGRQDEFSDCMSDKSVDRIVRDIKKNRLRLEAKYVTDGQGVVSGTLLVTTNTIMFDPNVSDRLVIDRGPNPYVMLAPFENVVRLAIVDDIAAMKWQRDSNAPPPMIYYGNQGCESVLELESPDVNDALSNRNSAVSDPLDIPLTNGASLNDNKRPYSNGDAEGLLNVSDNQRNMADGVTLAEPIKDVVLNSFSPPDGIMSQLDGFCDFVSHDDRGDEKSDVVLIKNHANLQDGRLENSPRRGLFVQRRLNQASIGLFPIDDEVEPNAGSYFPSSFSPVNEVIAGSRVRNSPCMFGSPSVRTGSYLSCGSPYETGKTFSNRPPSYSSVGESVSVPFVKKPSLSNMVESGADTPSRLIPVYSAKCIPRLGSNLPPVGSFGSFCIPPGQNFIVDLSWEQFGGITVEDGFCQSVYDMPPIIDEDACRMEKPDFYISDDEENADEYYTENSNENLAQSSEVDVEKLLRSTDELYKSLDVLIPRPAAHYEDLPLYLCVIIGCPMASRSSKAMMSPEAYSLENMKPVYWFSVRRNDIYPLYEFIMTHFPDIYGSEEDINPADRGLVVLSQEIIQSKLEVSTSVCQFFLEDNDLILPEMSEKSKILEDSHRAKLNCVLFPRGKDCYWKLVYSIDRDGASLQTLYRKMNEHAEHDPPCLIVIRDSSRTVFGAAMSCTIRRSTEYFGNGESFLFSFKDGFKKYLGSCINNYYGYGYQDGLCFGAYRGKCSLWIDDDVHHGRTQECATYDNEILTMTEDFYIHQFEAWCLV